MATIDESLNHLQLTQASMQIVLGRLIRTLLKEPERVNHAIAFQDMQLMYRQLIAMQQMRLVITQLTPLQQERVRNLLARAGRLKRDVRYAQELMLPFLNRQE